jgi:hypothetical protein
MITKFEFATYCLEVRKIHQQVGEWLDVDFILKYCNRNNKSLLELFITIGLCGQQEYTYKYITEFKYPEWTDIKFSDLPDGVKLSYVDILKKL